MELYSFLQYVRTNGKALLVHACNSVLIGKPLSFSKSINSATQDSSFRKRQISVDPDRVLRTRNELLFF